MTGALAKALAMRSAHIQVSGVTPPPPPPSRGISLRCQTSIIHQYLEREKKVIGPPTCSTPPPPPPASSRTGLPSPPQRVSRGPPPPPQMSAKIKTVSQSDHTSVADDDQLDRMTGALAKALAMRSAHIQVSGVTPPPPPPSRGISLRCQTSIIHQYLEREKKVIGPPTCSTPPPPPPASSRTGLPSPPQRVSRGPPPPPQMSAKIKTVSQSDHTSVADDDQLDRMTGALAKALAMRSAHIQVSAPLAHQNEVMINQLNLIGCDNNDYDAPNEFKCPITMDVMVDPVIIADGFTYEKESIMKWFSSGKATSPMTNLSLSHMYLIPNRSLKTLIESWTAMKKYK
nr:formin-like protein 7 [Hydra vulgaris]